MRFIHIVLFLLVPYLSMGQYGKEINLVNNRVIVNHTESTVYAFVLPEKPGKKPHDDLFYYWFASNDIKHTRGGFDGKLLHGQYTEFYLNKNLKEKGKVKYGLRQGTWKSWYVNGEYKEIVRYRNSNRVSHEEFYENGRIKSIGHYKDNKLHGNIKNYSVDGNRTKTKYRFGEPVAPRKKEKKFFRKRKSKGADSLTATPQQPTVQKQVKKKKRLLQMFQKKKDKTPGQQPSQPNQAPPSNQVQPPVQGQPPVNVQPSPEKKKAKKQKAAKQADQNIRIRKFLWIIPLEKEPAKGKQT